MEEFVIDWKDSEFEKDELYEDINAPQWLDFSANDLPPDDDEAWFCRPDCKHPKTVDDFFKETIHKSSKLHKLSNVSEIPPSGDRNWRDVALRKGEILMKKDSKSTKNIVKDGENLNPNFLTPPDCQAELIKLSTEKKRADDASLRKEETPRKLKSTFSARNLFAGKDILSQITEFCNELKRLASRTKEKRHDEHGEKEIVHKKPEEGVLREREIQRTPLLDAMKLKLEEMDKGSTNGKEKLRRKKRNDELQKSPTAENVKITRHKGKDEEKVLEKATPCKAFRRRPPA